MKIYKVKANKLSTLKKWGKFLVKNSKVVKSLLKAENCSKEFFFIFKITGEYYAVGHMEGGPFKASGENEINKRHKKVLKECLEASPVPLEKLYNITAE